MIVPRKPAGQNFDAYNPQFDDEIDLGKLWIRVVRHRTLAVCLTFLGALLGFGAGSYQASNSARWSATSKVVATAAVGTIGGVGSEAIVREMVSWRENEELKKAIEKSLTAPELSKFLSGVHLEVLKPEALEKEDAKIPLSLERRLKVQNAEGHGIVLKFLVKYTGKLNDLPATLEVDASDRETAPQLLNLWMETINGDLKQKKQPLITKGLQIAQNLKTLYEKTEPKIPKQQLPSSEAAASGIIRAGNVETAKGATVQLPTGSTLEFDPKLEAVETAIRVLELMSETAPLQPPVIERNKSASPLKQTVLGGGLGAFLGLGLLGGVLLLQSLRSDSLETENELASIFPESAVLTLHRNQPLKAVSKTVLWAAWVHAATETNASGHDFVLWQAGGGDSEAISELLVQEYRTHYPSLPVTHQKEPLPQTLLEMFDSATGAKGGLYVLSSAISVESLRLVRKSQKFALIINEAEPSLSTWKQNAAALELSGIRPNLVVLLS